MERNFTYDLFDLDSYSCYDRLVTDLVDSLLEGKLNVHYLFSKYYTRVIRDAIKKLANICSENQEDKYKAKVALKKIEGNLSLNTKYRSWARSGLNDAS